MAAAVAICVVKSLSVSSRLLSRETRIGVHSCITNVRWQLSFPRDTLPGSLTVVTTTTGRTISSSEGRPAVLQDDVVLYGSNQPPGCENCKFIMMMAGPKTAVTLGHGLSLLKFSMFRSPGGPLRSS